MPHASHPARKPAPSHRTSSPVPTLDISPDEHGVLVHLATELMVDAIDHPAAFTAAAHRLSRQLPERLAEALYDLELTGPALLIHGLPVGPIGATPTHPLNRVTHRTMLSRATAVIAAAAGHLVGYRAESEGRLIQTICPVSADSNRQASTGSVNLECHTEQAFNSTTRPDTIFLAAHRGDPDAATYAMSAADALGHLPTRSVRLLREPRFFTRIDDSFLRGGLADEVRGPMPVFSGPDCDPLITFDEDLQFSPSSAHAAALDELRALWSHLRHSVFLGPGDLLAIDNSRIVHGRSTYHPRYDGGDRWLARLQIQKSLTPSRHARIPSTPIIETHGT